MTDIDALGSRKGRLLVVSCKSLLYSDGYEVADYKVMRNMAVAVDKAVQAWSAVCASLRQDPMGDNFDFSRYNEIIGVVCTPTVIYTPLGPATQVISDGLFPSLNFRHGSKAIICCHEHLWLQVRRPILQKIQ